MIPSVFGWPITTLTKLAGRDKITFGIRAVHDNGATGKSAERVRCWRGIGRCRESIRRGAEKEDFLPARLLQRRGDRDASRGTCSPDGSVEIRRHAGLPSQGRPADRKAERFEREGCGVSSQGWH